MSTTASVLLTVVLVAGGIGTYHVLTADDAPTSSANPIALADRDLASLEDRLAALEQRGPVLQGSTTPKDIYDRLNLIEDRLAAFEKKGPVAARTSADETLPAPVPTVAAAGSEVVELPDGSASPLTAAQEKRIRELMEQAAQRRFQRGNEGRIDRTLQRLGIEITDDQKKKLDVAMTEHFGKVRDLFRSGRESGQSREDIRNQIQGLNQQFTQKVSEFIPAADAEAITSSLTSFGGDRGGRRGPPGGPGR